MLKELSSIIKPQQQAFEKWYQNKLSLANPCFYASVDIRYSGEQLVPIDTNLFPAGFNNLCFNSIEKAASLAKEYLSKYNSVSKKILLIGEDHTRNLHYLDSLKTLEIILNEAGYEIKICSLNATEYKQYKGFKHSEINIHPLTKKNNKLQTADGFIPDLIILNNDLSAGFVDILNNVEQKIIPHPHNGWFKRRKSMHFSIYNQLLQELKELFNLPSHLLTAEFEVCNGINFKSKQGMDTLAEKVDEVLNRVKEKYKKYNINQEPYIVIKSDYGTYGMGIMTIKNTEEIYTLNKKLRNQMHMTKSNVINEQVIIQEGIKTIDKIGGASAEPLLYFINHQQIEFLYRIHKEKDEYSNLNSVGMEIYNNHKLEGDYEEYRYCCDFITRIANLAAALELN